MKAIICIGISMILPAFFSCEKPNIFFSDKLSLERQDYTGNQLRIDGYYYEKNDTTGSISSTFLYRNGIIIFRIGGNDSFIENEKLFISNDYISNLKRYNWGLCEIENDLIFLESWHPSSGGFGSPAYVRAGEILNDTTFVLTELWRSNKKKKTLKTINEVYHFKQFSHKPDSTNAFID